MHKPLSYTLICSIYVSGETVELEEYEASAAGLIQSFTQRFTEDAEELEAQLLEMASRDATYWC